MGVFNKTVGARLAVIIGIVGLFTGYIYRHGSRTNQYEVVVPDVLYRATIQSLEDYANAEAKCYPGTIFAIGTTAEQDNVLLDTALRKAAKIKIRVAPMDIEQGKTPQSEQIDLLIKTTQKTKRVPVLVIGLDGERPGMMAAAYRLKEQKLPLDKVLELAGLPDAPAETTAAIRRFATSYAGSLATTRPVLTPSQNDAAARPALP